MLPKSGLEEVLCTHRDRVSVINLELWGLVLIEGHASRKQVKEGLEQVQIHPCHIGHLEDGAYPDAGVTKKEEQETSTKTPFRMQDKQ